MWTGPTVPIILVRLAQGERTAAVNPTFHALDEAHRLGIPVSEVVKTILLETRGGQALAVIPACRRLDLHLVREAIGDPHARLATEEEILQRFPTYPLGALPPLSRELAIPVYLDREIAGNDSVVFAASPTESVRISSEQVLSGPATSIVPLVAPSAGQPWFEAVAEEIELRASIEVDELDSTP